ncbi:MAG: sorbosone dehydrogenase family protein [Gemmatimonadaceae bacterium]|nr:sorbosone dehydrogenase family protein [Chitinophagaceae bacterium]
MKSLIFGCLAVVSVCHAQQSDTLPAPYATKSSMNFSNVIGWDDKKPVAPEGFIVTKYAEGFDHPRWLYVLPNGDVLVAESNSNYNLVEKIGGTIIGASKSNNLNKSADRISLIRDADKDGIAETKEIFLTNLAQPLGMLLLNNWLYVANTSSVYRVPYKTGDTKITTPGTKIMDLPAGKVNQHWTRNLIANANGSKIYVSVGSGSNIGEKGMEHEVLKASILEFNPDGSNMKVFASGLRNPVGMDWAPGTNTLWTVVNERDELGDDLVPDYLTSVKQGGFYGWPYVYWGQHVDPRVKDQPEIVKKTIVPDVDLGSHTASLGLVFYNKKAFPERYHNGAFVTQHGSWNRSVLSGYKVVFVPFKNGKAGKPEDFLTGFVADLNSEKVRGRPVGIALLADGSMLVADDGTNTIWKISVKK